MMKYFCLPLVFSLVVSTLIAFPTSGSANENKPPLPRFVSLKASEANVRVGPGIRYPIKWVLKRPGIPLEIIAEFNEWRRVRDIQNDEGWIHRSMLSSKRSAIITGQTRPLYKTSSVESSTLAYLEEGVHANILLCEPGMCKLRVGAYTGWVERVYLWGIYPQELQF